MTTMAWQGRLAPAQPGLGLRPLAGAWYKVEQDVLSKQPAGWTPHAPLSGCCHAGDDDLQSCA